MNAVWRVRTGLAGLILSNLLAPFVVSYWTYKGLPGALVVGGLQGSLEISQLLLLALWLALGDSKWYWRLLLVLTLAIGIGWARVWAQALGAAEASSNLEVAAGDLGQVSYLLAGLSLVLPLRLIRNWRWTARLTALAPATWQFRLADVMLWMLPIGGFLWTMRLLDSFWVDERPQMYLLWFLRYDALPALCYVAITMTGLLAANATRRGWLRLLILSLSLTLLISSTFAIREAYRLAPHIQFYKSQPLPPQIYESFYWLPLATFVAYLPPLLVGLINGVVMRRLGYRLVRPGAGSAPSFGTVA